VRYAPTPSDNRLRTACRDGPTKEYLPVALLDQVAAHIVLRQRRFDLIGGDFTVVGEASPESVEWLDVMDGQILSVLAA
jgi:hypothetical protein